MAPSLLKKTKEKYYLLEEVFDTEKTWPALREVGERLASTKKISFSV